jgi:hypothetical protein
LVQAGTGTGSLDTHSTRAPASAIVITSGRAAERFALVTTTGLIRLPWMNGLAGGTEANSGGMLMIKRVLFVIAIAACAAQAGAAEPTCHGQAAEKKLAGAALNSYMKKCEADAKAACDSKVQEKKLAGAAKDSFGKKCLADALGSK